MANVPIPKRLVPPRTDKAKGDLAEQAYHSILDQILRGTLGIGSVLSRRNLAAKLGMSFVPVSEAFQRLEMEGLLESRPRAGTRVKIPTISEARDRFELREALECQAARLCSERASFEERLELKRAAKNVDTLFVKAASKEFDDDFIFAVQKYHVDLHMKVAGYARSEALRSAIEKNHVLVFNWLYDTAMRRRTLPRSFHEGLINAILDKSPEEAEEAMRAHVRYGVEAVLSYLALAPETRKWRVKRKIRP